MASVVALVLVILISYVVVIAGSTAYELTGLDRETARFQALSAFTGTGFTTRVSQRVVGHPTRRRITSTLIILGYGGTATIVGTLVATINRESSFETASNLAVLLVTGLAAWFLLQRFGSLFLGDFIRRMLTGRIGGDRVPHEELLLYKAGFGITRIEIPKRSFVIGRQLKDLNLRALNLQVLAVEHDGQVDPIPAPEWTFSQGHHLIIYGDLRKVQAAFGPVDG